MSVTAGRPADAVMWHQVECGGYAGDLALWRRLAAERAGGRGRILDLGAGTGRTSLELTRAGHRVVALDRDDVLLAELAERARRECLEVETAVADVRAPQEAGRGFALIIAPMQLLHLLERPAERVEALAAWRELVAEDGLLAAALLDEAVELFSGMPEPLPDVRERAGWTYSSTPVEVTNDAAGVSVLRRRECLSPEGEQSTTWSTSVLAPLEPSALEREAEDAGWRAAGRERIEPTADHVGSIVVSLEPA